MRTVPRWMGLLCMYLACFSGGCDGLGQRYYLGQYASAIKSATQAIETARSDAERAQGFAERARGYSETARYSRCFNLIPPAEYGRLFELAVKDHDQAVALAPDDSQVYLERGRTYYDRAALEDEADPQRKAYFALAEADFTRAIEKDARNELAIDMRGLVHTALGDLDQAIGDFAAEAKINPHAGNLRLAEAHCSRGSSRQQEQEYDLAISDYEASIALGGSLDGCSCDPYSPLAWIYFDAKRQYDKSWEVVHKARRARKWIQPELLASLKQASGRNE